MKTFAASGFGLMEYVENTFGLRDDPLESMRAIADHAGLPQIALSRFDARHLEVITRAIGAKKAVEIGTLGGYSGAHIARALAQGGILYSFEYDAKHARVAREALTHVGLESRVKIIVGPALERLKEIEAEAPFDLVFIDADKASYASYLAWAEDYLRVGGVVLADNAFAFGNVTDRDAISGGDLDATGTHLMNERLGSGGRFLSTMIPTSEGLAMGVKIR